MLARLLHVVPYTAVLREPLVLRRLSDCADAGHDIRPWVKPLVALLSRPWRPHGHVVVKPTHAALNIAAGMMAATPASRAIILTSTLEDFLVSHLKKTRETLAKAPLLDEIGFKAVQQLGACNLSRCQRRHGGHANVDQVGDEPPSKIGNCDGAFGGSRHALP